MLGVRTYLTRASEHHCEKGLDLLSKIPNDARNEIGEKSPRVKHSSRGRDGFDPARQALLNGCVSLGRGLLNIGVIVAITPFLISHLGKTGFGVWSLLGLFITYVTLIDFGISGATAKFIGELSSAEGVERINRLFTSGMVLIGILACGALLLVPLMKGRLESGLATFGLFGDDAKIFLIGAVALYSVGLFSNGLLYVLLGLHRLDVANYIAASVILVQAVGTVLVLEAGLGLKGLIALMVGTSALSIIPYFIAARRLTAGLCFRWNDFSFVTVKKLLNFGIYLQVYALVGVYYFYVGKAVVGLRFPLAAVGAYEVALKLPILFRQGILTVLGPLMPAVSHLDARGGAQQVKALLVKALRYSLLLGAPIFVGVAVFAESIIRLWVGPEFSSSVLPLRILSIAVGLSVFADLVWYFLVGLGRQRLAVTFSLLEVAFGTLLSYFLAARWGLAGVALGVLFTSVLGALFYAVLLVRERVLSLPDLPVWLGVKVVVVTTAICAIVFELSRMFRLSYLSFILTVISVSVVYSFWIVKGSTLENEERLFVRRFVPSYLQFLC
jgi:O-antigen/teichoic acid export membrane protein